MLKKLFCPKLFCEIYCYHINYCSSEMRVFAPYLLQEKGICQLTREGISNYYGQVL